MLGICFDPGHGGRDPGVIGHGLTRECDVNLEISGQCLQMALADGMRITSTRCSDSFVPLEDRCRKANTANVDAFVSIHCNGAKNRKARGIEVWTSPGTTGADLLASLILERLHAALPESPKRIDMADGDVDKEGRFHVLLGTSMPSVLVECGFLSNPQEEASLANPDVQRLIARAIVDGIKAWDEERKGDWP